MPTARIFLAPGAYTGVGIAGGTVPTLTAGTIVQTSPVAVGTTLTVTGSNAPAGVATYQWQADSVNISGATGATYTVVAGDSGKAIRRTVTVGDKQTPVSTPTVTVGASLPVDVSYIKGQRGGLSSIPTDFIPAAGSYLFVTTTNSGTGTYTHTVAGPTITTAVQLGQSDEYPACIHLWHVVATGAGTITFTGTTPGACLLFKGDGLTNAGHITQALTGSLSNPVSLTLSAVPSSRWVVTVAQQTGAGITAFAFSDFLSNSNIVRTTNMTSAILPVWSSGEYLTLAAKEVTSTGNLTVTLTGTDAGSRSSHMIASALARG
jgi:hypothetical protein